VASGLAAGLLVQWERSAAAGWVAFALLAAVLSALTESGFLIETRAGQFVRGSSAPAHRRVRRSS